ncbi:MAG: DEAD/DEAH box helicase [Acidimicrobiales bacterium]|nr:DEAD/DEAH box helicase [Acidimicrobiales bacterium]
MTNRWPFRLDHFQREAIASIDAGNSVLVAAPTSSGKTVVAEHAIDRALEQGLRTFYTAPIKALSNQKYRDLTGSLGTSRTGLLTGDNTISPLAPVVVMTTEVLRNMLYSGSEALEDLGWVVLDEVHFLEDPYRGAVWEEVLLNLPQHVGIVALSATVSNAEELGAWMRDIRGVTDVVVEKQRPVPLRSHYLVSERRGSRRLHRVPVLTGGAPNRKGGRFDVEGRRGRNRHGPGWASPRRREVLGELQQNDLLPAIHFIFSRAGCDDARDSLIRAGVELNSPSESDEVDSFLSGRLAAISVEDLEALGVKQWQTGLRRGIACHHAGMLPLFKELVEELFASGLLKIVYATETLALGVNLPARSVVIEKLTKFTGETHELLTAGQFTQLTGRAGRRGIDDVGNALICWTPFVPFRRVAELARSRDFVLISAFRPTYNMLANLMATRTRPAAMDLVERSFAQFQDRRRQASGSNLVERLDGMERVLEQRGMSRSWSLTTRGAPLAGIHNEADLLVVEALAAGLLDDMSPGETAAVVSCLTYRRRGPRGATVPEPPDRVGSRIAAMDRLGEEIRAEGAGMGVEVDFTTDHGLAETIMEWVDGGSLASILEDGMTAGEFVRNVRLVADLLGQIAKVSDPDLATTARRAVDGLERGVVAFAGAISESDDAASADAADSPEAA